MRTVIVAAVIAMCAACAAAKDTTSAPFTRVHHRRGALPFGLSHPASRIGGTPTAANCTERYFTQKLDHFAFAEKSAVPGVPQTYQQRFFTCLEHNWRPNGTFFFYTGNEADVTLFISHTGLMWENADKFGAVLVFAEHRFFGKSQPFPGEDMPSAAKLGGILTVDQALADYAVLIEDIRENNGGHFSSTNRNSAIIGFGGSYGGMLCSWLRIKYPNALDGCIAGSAPIVNFDGMHPAYDFDGFAKIETLDATAAGGAAPQCADNIRAAWVAIDELEKTAAGTAKLAKIFRLCKPSLQPGMLKNYLASAFADMSMSSYPYPSSYLLLGGKGILPAYPMRVACKSMAFDPVSATQDQLLEGLFKATLVYYNATSEFTCNNLNGDVNHATQVVNYLWNYLSCTTMFMPMSTNGKTDMFWDAPWSNKAQIASCQEMYSGTTPQPFWAQVQYGGWGVAHWGSNIVFSNGQLDPWRPGGIQRADSAGITTVIIPDAGHHIDLMFSDPRDTPAIRAARQLEVDNMRQWVEKKKNHG